MQGTERRWRLAFLAGVLGSVVLLSVFSACREITPPPSVARPLSAPSTPQRNMAVDWYECSLNLAFPEYGWTCQYIGCEGACSDYPPMPSFADPDGFWNPCTTSDTCTYPTGTGSHPSNYDGGLVDTTLFRNTYCQAVQCIIAPAGNMEKRLAQAAIALVPQTDTLCVKLAAYISIMIGTTPARVFTYDVSDNPATVGVTQWTTGVGPDYLANVYVKDSIMLNLKTQKENGRTLIHEAYHGFMRSGDDGAAEAMAQRCIP